MSVQIDVQHNERGPAEMRVRQLDRFGQALELERLDPYLTACEEDAYERLLATGRRLPAGSIEVVVAEDEFRRYPASRAVGEAIARVA